MTNKETEDERSQRIRDIQIEARQRGGLKKPPQRVTPKKPDVKVTPLLPVLMTLFTIPKGGMQDIARGLAYGLLPALLLFIFLPDWFKLLAILLLAVTGAMGYLLGTVPE